MYRSITGISEKFTQQARNSIVDPEIFKLRLINKLVGSLCKSEYILLISLEIGNKRDIQHDNRRAKKKHT
jgi:hypothetical protein